MSPVERVPKRGNYTTARTVAPPIIWKKTMLFASQAYLAARTAILAEHDLGYIELVPENPFAARLRDVIMSAFRAGTKIRFDKETWVAMFNHASRLVQLNFIAMGFNELRERPMLAGEDWQLVQNPMVIRNIESKLDKAARDIARRHGKMVRLRNSRLALKDFRLSLWRNYLLV